MIYYMEKMYLFLILALPINVHDFEIKFKHDNARASDL